MRRIYIPALAIFTILVAGALPFFDAAADDKNCTLRADEEDVHVFVWDEDSEGARKDELFEGWIKKGYEKQIRSMTGLVTFNYRRSSDERSYGDNHATCKNGNTIRVP
jgi:hypothetical protein